MWRSKIKAFPSLDKAWKSFPRVSGKLRILVFNLQGQPVIQYSSDGGANTVVDERECALGMELARVIYNSITGYSGSKPERVAFFFPDQVITIERFDPFVLMVFWPQKAARLDREIEEYLDRLALTLQEEFT